MMEIGIIIGSPIILAILFFQLHRESVARQAKASAARPTPGLVSGTAPSSSPIPPLVPSVIPSTPAVEPASKSAGITSPPGSPANPVSESARAPASSAPVSYTDFIGYSLTNDIPTAEIPTAESTTSTDASIAYTDFLGYAMANDTPSSGATVGLDVGTSDTFTASTSPEVAYTDFLGYSMISDASAVTPPADTSTSISPEVAYTDFLGYSMSNPPTASSLAELVPSDASTTSADPKVAYTDFLGYAMTSDTLGSGATVGLDVGTSDTTASTSPEGSYTDFLGYAMVSETATFESIAEPETAKSTDPVIQAGVNSSLSERLALLGAGGDPRKALHLSQHATHSDVDVRKNLATALGQFAARARGKELEAIANTLAKLSKDTNSEVRLQAVEALGQIRSAIVVPLLQQAQKLPDSKVSKAASIALERLKSIPQPKPAAAKSAANQQNLQKK